MKFWKRKKKQHERQGELAMRLHAGMMVERREATVLYRANQQLRGRVAELEEALVDVALERDKLFAWWEKWHDRLEELERETEDG